MDDTVRNLVEVELTQSDYEKLARSKLPKSMADATVSSMRSLPRFGDQAQHSACRTIVVFEIPLKGAK